MTATDVIAIIGSLAAGITLIINTWFSAQAKNISADTNMRAKRHEAKINNIVDTVDAIDGTLNADKSQSET